MSVLSTVTGSLPNVLNLLQGSWKVQYKTASKKEDTLLNNIMGGVQDILAWVNSKESENDGAEWKDLDFDSFVDMQEIQDTQITQNPVEGGSFRSVNKVRKPKQIKVTLAKAGIGYGIEDTLAEVKSLVPLARYSKKEKKSTGLNGFVEDVKNAVISGVKSLFGIEETKKKKEIIPMEFRVITPFDMIKSLNLVKLDYTFKKDTGRNMLLMYLTFEEIINVSKGVNVLPTKVKEPTNADNQNVGRLSLQ